MSPILGELLAVTKLAWDLYHNCFLVAKEAPDDFRQLVTELGSLQGVLKNLRDDVNSDKSFVERLDENRKEMLERCLSQCFDTLRMLQKLVIKHRDLGIRDGLQFWMRMKWVGKQGEISDLKERIQMHTCRLSLCLSSIGNSSLARIESSMIRALERQDAAQEDTSELTPLTKASTAPTGSHLEVEATAMERTQSHFSGTTLTDPHVAVSPDFPSSASEGGGSEFGASITPVQSPRKPSNPVSSKVIRLSHLNTERETKIFPPTPTRSDGGFQDDIRGQYPEDSSFTNTKRRALGVSEVVADAMQELSRIRQREQTSRPLKIRPQDPIHKPDDALRLEFESDARDEMEYRKLNTKDWLRLGTWWLLKARFNLQSSKRLDSTKSSGSSSASNDPKSPANQAYVDLLKASWIMYDNVLDGDNLSALQTDENRKLFYNLSDGIREELDLFRPVDIPDQQTLKEQKIDCSIWEHLQPEEEAHDDDDLLLLPLDNSRWITVERDDAGEEGEDVLFRTFVDAAIGGKKRRVRSKGTPYMLILSTKEGESEPKVTLCNQSGSLGITRDFTTDDLQEEITTPASPIPGMALMGCIKSLPLNFGRLEVVAAFTNEEDLQRFMRIPRNYFKVVKRREPRHVPNATEVTLFGSSIEVVEKLKPTSMLLESRKHHWCSCDVRVLETRGKVGWKTTRRLVLSSSAGEENPWCTEYFLPLSRVQVRREGHARQVLVKWSDCGNEKSERTDGKYHPIYDYVYDQHNANHAFSFLFRNQIEAATFVNTVLRLSHPPIHTWSTSLSSGSIYSISDGEPAPKEYRAVELNHTRLEWAYSDLFYLYRDTDYVYDHAGLRIRFPQAQYTDYISTHVDKLYKAPAEALPHFSHCERKTGLMTIEFPDESAQDLITALATGFQLIFSRRALYITTRAPSRFGSSKSNKGHAEVQLWRKGNITRLVSRWGDTVEDKWLSMAIPNSGINSAKDTNKVIIPGTSFEKGRVIDMASLVARNPREEGRRRAGSVTVVFETSKDREEFAAVVEGREPKKQQNEMDDLINLFK